MVVSIQLLFISMIFRLLSIKIILKFQFNLTMAKWGDGGWKPNALNVFKIDICNVFYKNVLHPWNTVMQAAGRKDGSCPIAKVRQFSKMSLFTI